MTTIILHFPKRRARDRRFSQDPSKSPAQHRFMEAVAHDPKFRKKVGVPKKVGEEFTEKDDCDPFARAKLMGDEDPVRRVVEQTRRVSDAYRVLEVEKAKLDALPKCDC